MKILQISPLDWSKKYTLDSEWEWHFLDPDASGTFDTQGIKTFDVVIINTFIKVEDLLLLEPLINPYTVLIDKSLENVFDASYESFFRRMAAQFEDFSDPLIWLETLGKKYFTGQFGQKLLPRKILLSPFHKDKAWFEGTKYLSTYISYGEEYRQLMFWKLNIEYESQFDMSLWLEYRRDEGCTIEFDIQFILSGSPDMIVSQKRYTEEEMANPIIFSNTNSGYLVCSVFAKGAGLVRMGPIHYRHYRHEVGDFLPGGKRIVDQFRQELFYYFHPGDLKPPLNIYFAGYRPAEGFEGFYMMKKFGNPFLLITDPRLEGGNFYVGTHELEEMLTQVIAHHVDLLGIKNADVIFSGLSMGSFGAIYYGFKFKPHAIIVGKPILDIEYVADRTRLVRPYDFLTVLDMAEFWEKTDDQGDEIPLEKFQKELVKLWSEGEGFGDTKLLMARMKQDDYDDQAYYTLLNTQLGKETTIIARGYEGRHNDQNTAIVDWFTGQYKRVIREYIQNHSDKATDSHEV